MNDTPPPDDQGDDLEEMYRSSASQTSSRPSAKVRQAILEHAEALALDRSHAPGVRRIPRVGRSSTANWRRSVFVGSLAAAALAGLLVGPQFLRPSAPPQTIPAAPTAPTSALNVPKSTAPSVAAMAQPSESPPAAVNLPATGSARDLQTPAVQVASRAPAAAPANSYQAAASASVTAMRARPAPDAPSGDSAPSQVLLSDAAAIDARDAQGRTALMLAVLQGRLDTVVSLLRRGADPNAADLAGMTPLQAALANQKPDIAEALRRAGAR